MTMDTIEKRVQRLERSLRRWRCLACVAGAVVAASLLTGAAAPRKAADDVRARKVILLDAQGRAAGELSAEALFLRHAGSEIRLQIQSGAPGAAAAAEGVPSVALLRKATPRAVLRVDARGAGFTLHDGDGVRRAALGHVTVEYPLTGRLEQLPENSVATFDRRGRVEWQAGEANRP
jgi:hypothetical protein